jgi:predicted Zn-dependent protease
VDRFPADLEAQCQFGAIWLGLNRPEEAATIFKNVLEAEPGHPLAQAFLGYILKVHNGELERGVQLLRKAIRSGRAEVIGDPKWHL